MDFAQIHLLDAPFSVDRPYTYAIPPHLAEQVRAGRLVTVPFGRGSRPAPGVVTALCDTCDYPQVKSVLSVSDDLFSLTPPMLALALYLCESTLCTVVAPRCHRPEGLRQDRAQRLLPSVSRGDHLGFGRERQAQERGP